MNYLNPRLHALLPASCAPQLLAYLNVLAGQLHDSADGWTSYAQARFARALARSVRNVKRYERTLRDLGLLEVGHHGRGNRRRVRLSERARCPVPGPRPAPRALREWGHACPDGARSC